VETAAALPASTKLRCGDGTTINQPHQLDRLTQTLRKVEDSLGQLLANVTSSTVSGA